MKYLIAILLLFSASVYAAESTVSWTLPTENTDGTSIKDGDLIESIVYQDNNEVTRVAFPTTVAKIPVTDPGTYCYTVRVVNKWNVTSDPSAEACATLDPSKPNPPNIISLDLKVSISVQ